MAKKWVIAAIAAVLTMGINITAQAAGWQQDANGWWWDNGNGTWASNNWYWLDGNNDGVQECYYFGMDGYMYANTTTPDGYTVNSDGAWTVNGVVQTKQITAPVSVDNTYNAQGVSNVALEMLENSREENMKYGEVEAYNVQSSVSVRYANGFTVKYGIDKYVTAQDRNYKALFEYYSDEFSSAEEAADYLHSHGFSDGYGETYANGNTCWVGLDKDYVLQWRIPTSGL